jgi:hypothetical protein
MQRGLGLIIIIVWVIAIIIMLFMLKKSIAEDSTEDVVRSVQPIEEMENNGKNWLLDI